MKITRNLRAISKITLALLLLIALIVGAVISYMFVMGYIVSLALQLPKNPAVTIVNVTFSPQNATTFNVTILNPSFCPSTANVTSIIAVTEDGSSYNTTILYPLPKEIEPGNLENFTCSWDWSGHTGEKVTIHAFVEGGSGATFEAVTPFMDFRITNVYFNSPVSTTQFSVTLQNAELSATYVNVTSIRVTLENRTVREITEVAPTLPYTLNPNSSETFMCWWNWTDYRSKDIGIAAHTLQGYRASRDVATPERVILNITEAIFNATDTTHFNVTVKNSELSSIDVDITKIGVTIETLPELTIQNVTPPLPYNLSPDSLAYFRCRWNWTDYQRRNVTITVYTLQGYAANYTKVASPLNITEVIFDATDTTHFNVTVENPEPSPTYVNITKITVTMENGTTQTITEVVPQLPCTLYPNNSTSFKCRWSWTFYRNQSVIISIHTLQGYMAYSPEVTPPSVNLTITEVLFDASNTTQFDVTVRNSELSPTYANITRITITLENRTIREITNVNATFPYILNRGDSVTFVCSWDWTLYRGKSLTVTVHQWQGYPANYIQVTPPPVILTITEALFNITDTTHFNVTIENSIYSLTYDVITQLTVALENGTILETIEVTPFVLYPNSSHTFICSWDWTKHKGINLIITVYSIRGYTASAKETP